ncbi:peptidase M24, structural domain-containing protein [Lentinula aciculospora]|uniref:Peptidase M24, structural domain-containing protein n=1 Tax=Lentinula aciculospora TaxID=153920 RepID=A0A9W9DX86_9AGAR|nr:peptidase M24, structural domain-containing protein [Lentinula aciculospora]
MWFACIRAYHLQRIAFVLLVYVAWIHLIPFSLAKDLLGRVFAPSIPFSDLANYCQSSQPINASEFHERQRRLARTLHYLNASAYITEPGASAQYFGNISTTSWKLSERPLLLIITPVLVNDSQVEAKVSILTPRFEATRAKMLPIPHDGVEYIEWSEENNPYEIAASAFSAEGKVYLDDTVRLFIFNGFQKAIPDAIVAPTPPEIKELRQRKSDAEIELLKCANEATLLAIRAVHKKMTIGMKESEARRMMSMALKVAGLDDGGCLTLFGENAALPHGSGSDRVLGQSDFALFDCGGSLHGYVSDVTRTVALPKTKVPSEHRAIWGDVLFAQTVASRVAVAGAIAQDVDASARSFLDLTGRGAYFTHRLGHGIGLEVHEEPYLRGGSLDIIKTGHTFSNEPGIYIEGKVGVRLEDCFYIDGNGQSIFLTENVGGQALSPWNP